MPVFLLLALAKALAFFRLGQPYALPLDVAGGGGDQFFPLPSV